jgi:hypothetical protein
MHSLKSEYKQRPLPVCKAHVVNHSIPFILRCGNEILCPTIFFKVQWYFGLQVTWSASGLQDEQKLLINFNLINEQCLAMRVLYYLYALSAKRHMITSRSGLWVIVSYARSQSAYLIRIVNIRASVVITCVRVKHFFTLCPNVVTLLY